MSVLATLPLAASIALGSAVIPQDPEEGPLLEDRLLATYPKRHEPFQEIDGPRRTKTQRTLPFTVSPDGRRVAYLAAKKSRVYGFIGDDDVGYGTSGNRPVFSSNGAHVAIALCKENKNRTEDWTIYVDGKSAAKEDRVGALSISPNGETLAYWTQPDYRLDQEGDTILDRHCLVVSHKKRKKYSATTSEIYTWADYNSAPLLIDDGTRALGSVYGDERGNSTGYLIAVGGREQEIVMSNGGWFSDVHYARGYERIAATTRSYGSSTSTSEEKKLLLSYRRYALEIDGAPLNIEVDAAALPEFSRNGEHYAFVYHEDKKFGVGIDGELLPTVEGTVVDATVDGTGTQAAWIVNIGGKMAELQWLGRGSGVWIEKGKFHVAIAEIAREDGKPTVAREQFSDAYDSIHSLLFSPDEQRIAFLAMDELGWHVVVDAERIGPFEEVNGMRWLDDQTVGVGTREGRELWWRTLSVD